MRPPENIKEIDRICRKYKIRYALDAGTLIGAVRQGVYPWDDDADVVFLRSQYEAFVKVAGGSFRRPWNFSFRTPTGTERRSLTSRPGLFTKTAAATGQPGDAFYGGKLNHCGWICSFSTSSRRQGGAALPAFHKAIYGLAMGHRPGLDFKKYSLLHKIFVGGLAGVGRLIPLKLIFAMQKAAALKDRNSRGDKWYYSNYQPDYLYVTLDKRWCEAVEDADFEDTRLMIPKGWHEVLTEVYGDYMKLPPVDKRVPTHSSQQIEVWERGREAGRSGERNRKSHG